MNDKNNITERTDFEIIEDVLHGNVNAFEILVKKYEKMIYNLCYTKTRNKETAFDLSQECFLKVYKSLANFKNTSAFSTWIYSICKNLITDYFRKNKNEMLVLSYYDDAGDDVKEFDVPDAAPTPEVQILNAERDEIVREAIMKLPVHLSEVIILRDIKDMNYNQICETLGIDLGTVKSRIFRGREKLKKLLRASMKTFDDTETF